MRVLSLTLVFLSYISFAQISFADLKSAGINSESDLKSLGVSQSEIDALKEEYVKSTVKTNPSTSTEQVVKSTPVEKEKEIIIESQKDELISEKVYGQSIFRSGSVSIQENSDRIVPPADYVLGSGDKVSVTIWGVSQFSGEFLLDEFGNITPNLVGRINLKGKTFSQAQKILQKRFSEVYRFNSSQIAINLSYSKVISVNVVGEVVAPGTYSVPSINSAFNILTLSKGLSENGSVRNIAIVRNGKIINRLDVLEFMINPNKNSFIHLKDGDFIVVPTLENTVLINGEVVREGNYELKESETLYDLIKFSGGFTPLANKNLISIIRQTNDGKVVLTYSLEQAEEVKIQNGDQVLVGRNSARLSKKITVSGEVNSPGIFEFNEGETFDVLLKKVNGLTNQAYKKTAHIYRLNSILEREVIQISLLDSNNFKSIKIYDLDEVFIFNKINFIDTNFITLNGQVRSAGKIEYKNGITLGDALTLAGKTLPQADLARIEIERINFKVPSNDTLNYVTVLFKNLESDFDFELNPFDIVNVRALPEFKFQESIEIVGEVKYPGKYSLTGDKNKVSDLIERAGGTTNLSYGQKAYIERTEDNIGVILLDLNLALKNNKNPNNYSLRPGDKIVIPRVNNIVSLSGAIGAKYIDKKININVAYKKNKRASHYIKKHAGGYDKRAERRKVYAVTQNGQIKRTKFWGLLKPKIEKGDLIIVKSKPEKVKREKTERVNWNRVIENLTVKITGITTLYILLSTALN